MFAKSGSDFCLFYAITAVKLSHGIPAEVVSDNGPQFTSSEFKQFVNDYGFKHTTSSPHYPQANGKAERTIQTVKNLWRENDDKYLALLDYRTTPLPDIGLSPAQLLMGRRLKTELPMVENLLTPTSNNQDEISKHLKKTKEDQKNYHDRHASKRMKELKQCTKVKMQLDTDSKPWRAAIVVRHHHTPRSYVVQEEEGRNYRLNRQHLRVCPAREQEIDPEPSSEDRANLTVAKDKSDQAAPPAVLPDPTSQEQHSQLPKESSGTPYVTRKGRQALKPNRLFLLLLSLLLLLLLLLFLRNSIHF